MHILMSGNKKCPSLKSLIGFRNAILSKFETSYLSYFHCMTLPFRRSINVLNLVLIISLFFYEVFITCIYL